MEESPTEKDKDRMFDEKPDYGQSLREYIRWMITTNSNYRERLQEQDSDWRARAIKELVSKWRKDQITHTDYKGESKPNLYKQAIVKHASDWFEGRIKKEMDIRLNLLNEEKLRGAEAPSGKKRKISKFQQKKRARRATTKQKKHRTKKHRKD